MKAPAAYVYFRERRVRVNSARQSLNGDVFRAAIANGGYPRRERNSGSDQLPLGISGTQPDRGSIVMPWPEIFEVSTGTAIASEGPTAAIFPS